MSYFEITFEGNNFTKHLHITTKYYQYFGRCYSIHPKDHVLKLGVNAIEIVARLKVYTYFGHPGQFTYSNTKTKVSIFLLFSNTLLKINYYFNIFKFDKFLIKEFIEILGTHFVGAKKFY